MTLGRHAAVLCGGGALSALAVIGAWAWTIDYGLSREIWLLRATGYAALTALVLALAMSPLAALRRRFAGEVGRAPGVFRRSLGITAACLVELDEYESVDDKHYYQGRVEVRTTDGQTHQAITYFAYEQSGGPFHPSPKYVQVMIDGAVAHGLSEGWVEWLRMLQREVHRVPNS